MAKDSSTGQIHSNDKTGKESQRSQHAEKMHRTVAEFGDEIDGDQIQVAAHETVKTELAGAYVGNVNSATVMYITKE